jgi:hypothetical protein
LRKKGGKHEKEKENAKEKSIVENAQMAGWEEIVLQGRDGM